jgi:hypothetical protein
MFANNRARGDGGAIAGILQNAEALSITSSQLSGNLADGQGAGLYVSDVTDDGKLMLSGDTFTNNTTVNEGGGLWTSINNTTITGSTFTGNKAASGGGGVSFRSNGGATSESLTITACTLNGNQAGSGLGGALLADAGAAYATLVNDTLLGNFASEEGGAISAGSATAVNLLFDTVVGNLASIGGGIYNASSGGVTLGNSVVAGNMSSATPAQPGSDGYDLYGSFSDLQILGRSVGHNFIGVLDGNFNSNFGINNADVSGTFASPRSPKLSVLSKNGGPTKTIKPLTGSPLRGGALFDNFVQAITTLDERGKHRPTNGPVDIGAYQTP